MTKRLAAFVLVATSAAAMTACSSDKNGNGTATTPIAIPSSSPTPSETVPTTAASSSTAHPSTAPTTTHATVVTSRPTTKPPAQPLCTTATLRVDVLRGGAIPGREIAVIMFTNNSAATCVLVGYPALTLRLHGQQIGSPAQHTTHAPTLITLPPHGQAQSEVTDITACQAPISDTARITPPGSKAYVDRPLEMRACSVFVGPVTKASN